MVGMADNSCCSRIACVHDFLPVRGAQPNSDYAFNTDAHARSNTETDTNNASDYWHLGQLRE